MGAFRCLHFFEIFHQMVQTFFMLLDTFQELKGSPLHFSALCDFFLKKSKKMANLRFQCFQLEKIGPAGHSIFLLLGFLVQ